MANARKEGARVRILDANHFECTDPLRGGNTNSHMESGGRAIELPRGNYEFVRFERSREWYAGRRNTRPDYDSRFLAFSAVDDARSDVRGVPIHHGMAIHARVTAAGIVPYFFSPEYE